MQALEGMGQKLIAALDAGENRPSKVPTLQAIALWGVLVSTIATIEESHSAEELVSAKAVFERATGASWPTLPKRITDAMHSVRSESN